jgi:hypothetical protein
MIRNSLLAAALAFASFTALPALAQSTPASPPAPVASSVQTDAHKATDKPAEKPAKDAKAKSDDGTKTDSVTK